MPQASAKWNADDGWLWFSVGVFSVGTNFDKWYYQNGAAKTAR